MRFLTLLSTTLLLTLAMPFAEAREVKRPAPHKATSHLSRTTHAKVVNRNNVRPHRELKRPLRTGAHKAVPSTNWRVVARARELIGLPYRYGGTTLASGFDCSGLLVYLFRTEAGMQLPRTTGEMIEEAGRHVARDELKPGDAVFFNHNGRGNVSHVGLYIGNNLFIHAPSSGERVRMDSLNSDYWERSFTTARRFNG
ncbi:MULTISPECIES: C40 family peptidase [Pseudomonas]|uniref:C40 family peptidase n=1 Tax=Pseudomonas nitroreducens TaxID=46680 RepID=A0ABS0KU12_PSENT|nr:MULTISPECIES: C40 family peptidase [Pseudomonas]MBG6291524.1 C40 family peptidase [Pseudomonas nitroreducens]MCJ1877901.1 C40 family peptidase [Pseudomonas nitroreducens]MCJ1894298.1 C40 family peptidase [Pseudomonas nitroreducens]MDG9855055.1 C40 family peptidase [Pseudomonas nitroreducens]MDH1074104.1 C40 family peptidase [Pseudomonas nitroreducens]